MKLQIEQIECNKLEKYLKQNEFKLIQRQVYSDIRNDFCNHYCYINDREVLFEKEFEKYHTIITVPHQTIINVYEDIICYMKTIVARKYNDSGEIILYNGSKFKFTSKMVNLYAFLYGSFAHILQKNINLLCMLKLLYRDYNDYTIRLY